MASRELVLSEPLCFICSKIGKIEIKSLKSTVADFFRPEDITAAKVRLLDDVGLLQLTDKLPHIPRRREDDSRTACEVDDIFTLINCLDERKLLCSLPRYVTDNPDNMPTMRLFEGDLSFIMKKLDFFDGKMDIIGNAVAAMLDEVRSKCTLSSSDWPPLRSTQPSHSVYNKPVNEPTVVRTSSVASDRQNELFAVQARTQNDDQLIHPQGTVWSAVTSTPTAAQNQRRRDQNGDAGRSSSVGDSNDNDQPFVEVAARKRRHRVTNGERTPTVDSNSAARSQPRRGPLVQQSACQRSCQLPTEYVS